MKYFMRMIHLFPNTPNATLSYTALPSSSNELCEDDIPTSLTAPPIHLGFDRIQEAEEMTDNGFRRHSRYTNHPILKLVLAAILPSFLHNICGLKERTKLSEPQPTTYLNGLRGVAAITVFLLHYTHAYIERLDISYLSTEDDTSFLQLPIIRLLFSGRFAVFLFFVISGFALSIRPLELIRKGDSTLLHNLASSLFRRAPRLFLPTLLPLLITATLIHLDMFGDGLGIRNPYPTPQLPDYSSQIYHELQSFIHLVDPFHDDANETSLGQLWTLPVEFRGSIVVYLLLLCFSIMKPAVRMTAITTIALYCIWNFHQSTFLFLAGILSAEFHLIRNNSIYRLEDLARPLRIALQILRYALLLMSLLLGSYPRVFDEVAPGYAFLASITPNIYDDQFRRDEFWLSFAAVMLIMALESNKLFQAPFTSRVGRYLGDISFSLYIMHIVIIWSIGAPLTKGVIDLIGNHEIGFVFGGIGTTMLVFWAADLHWRLCDKNAIKFSKWLAHLCQSDVRY